MNRALIIGDVQQGITDNFDFSRAVIEPIADLLAKARAGDVRVIFVRAALRGSGVDLHPGNTLMKSFFDAGDLFHEGSPGTEVDRQLAPLPHEPIVTKRRVSAFHGTDLDVILRSQRVDTLALAGVATSAMVMATMLDALDLDYSVTVVRDGCADFDPEVNEFLLDRVFPARGATVVSAGDWLE